MKKLFSLAPAALCSILVLAATIAIKPMCIGFLYQPELPESLRK
ncbi:MAG: cyclic lactone autoinducer peptide [Desulfotomaculales bacterium]